MSKFCPEWIFGIFAAQTSKEFLSTNNSIAAVSRKYSNAISERYNEVKFEEVMDLAEKILQFLSDINAGEEAVTYIDDYIHYRVNFEASGSERKLSGMFSSTFDPGCYAEWVSFQHSDGRAGKVTRYGHMQLVQRIKISKTNIVMPN